MPARRSLTLYAALLFAAVAALVVSAVGFYLYRSVEEAMLRRSDVMVAGRVEHFRNLLRDNLTLAELKARPRLFENMLGNEQDILLLGQPGEAPIVAVNPRHERLPSLRVVAAGQALNPSVVHAALTHDGVPMRVLAAEVLVGGREPLQITAAHLLLGETRMLAQYRDRVIAAVLLAFLGTALLGWLVLRHGLRPLRTLAAKAAEIHPTSLDTRLDVAAAPAELQQVAQSFNAMLERLDDGYQRLQQFSADLAHEIRTPIGSLMGHGQVALRQPRSNEEYQALIASNQEELERIARMVESILFLARADDVRAAVERSRLDLGEELRRQAEYFEGLAEERGLSLDVQVSGQLRADPQLFRRALSNLLANDHVEQPRRVALSAMLLTTYGVGACIGPLVAGALMRHFGPGLFYMLVSGYAVLLVFWVQPKRVTGEHRVDEAPLQHVAMPDTVSPMAATLDPRVEEVPEELVVEAPANIGRSDGEPDAGEKPAQS